MSAPGLLGAVDRRLNPILVKEVRQALRGRYFTVVFWLTIVVAAVIAMVMLSVPEFRNDDTSGQDFFVAMYGCLSVAVHLFVPFATFLSVGSEWDENTYDLLVLSNLKPRQIVLGKLSSSLVQLLLFYSAFGPFLVFAFLLRGLDLTAAGWVLGPTVLTSLGLSAVALCLSSLLRQRFSRVLLMAVLAGILGMSTVGSIVAATGMLQSSLVHAREFVYAASIFLSMVATLTTFALILATTRFAHEEENRSTGLRLFSTGALLAALGLGWWLSRAMSAPEFLPFVAMAAVIGTSAMAVLYAFEKEGLGRRVRHTVPRNPLLALLATPFLPGGGRGVVLFVLQLGVVVGLLHLWMPTVVAGYVKELPQWVVGAAFYALVYVLLPSTLLARWSDRLRMRVAARLSVPLLFLLGMVVPGMVGLLIQDRDLQRMRHPGAPPWAIERWVEGDGNEIYLVFGLAGVLLALNLRRVVRGLREVLAASAARRRAERGRGARLPAGEGRADPVA